MNRTLIVKQIIEIDFMKFHTYIFGDTIVNCQHTPFLWKRRQTHMLRECV